MKNRSYWLNLLRIYHPDNTETGNADKFKSVYSLYENNQEKSLKLQQHITPQDAYFGCTLKTPSQTEIKLPKNYYPTTPIHIINDSEDILLYIKILDEDNLWIRKNPNNGKIDIHTTVELSLLDLLLGYKDKITIFDITFDLTIPKNFDIIGNNHKVIKHKNYKKGQIITHFKMKKLDLTTDEIDTITKIRENYGK